MEADTTAAVSGAFKSFGSLVGGFQQSSADDANAKIADQNAQIAQDQAAQKAAALKRDAYRLRGAQSAAAGASGVTQDSIGDVVADSAQEAELDALNALYGGKMQARAYKQDAAAYRARASDAVSSGIFGAGSEALSGWQKWKTANTYLKTINDPMVG